MKPMFIVAAILVASPLSHALPISAGSSPLEIVKAQADAYEQARLAKVADAKARGDYEAFLQEATAEEIAADAGVSLDDGTPENVSNRNFKIQIMVDIASQQMEILDNEAFTSRVEPVATAGRHGGKMYSTPKGCHSTGLVLDKHHWSRKYNAPMPNSVFFIGGVALHAGSVHQRSHGCVHLESATSLYVYNLVKANPGDVEICVQ